MEAQPTTEQQAPSYGAARRAIAGGVLAVATVLGLTACTLPAASGIAGPLPEPSAGGTAVLTQNGTASFVVPEGWSVEDRSRAGENHEGEVQWWNDLVVTDASGDAVLHYLDGWPDGAGYLGVTHTVVDERPAVDEYRAAAWVIAADEGELVLAEVAVAGAFGTPASVHGSRVEGRSFSFFGELAGLPGCASFATVAAAEHCLEQPSVDAMLDVLATLELYDVAWDAMP